MQYVAFASEQQALKASWDICWEQVMQHIMEPQPGVPRALPNVWWKVQPTHDQRAVLATCKSRGFLLGHVTDPRVRRWDLLPGRCVLSPSWGQLSNNRAQMWLVMHWMHFEPTWQRRRSRSLGKRVAGNGLIKQLLTPPAGSHLHEKAP